MGGTNGVSHPVAAHNCRVGEIWFFPALSFATKLSDPNLVVAYVDAETKNGVSVQHLKYSLLMPTLPAGPSSVYSQLSTTHVYLNSSSHLPIAIAFNVHPDNNMLVDIPVEVDFSDYQTVEGVQVPFHIQKYLNGSLLLDLTVQNAVVNSGIADSVFAIN